MDECDELLLSTQSLPRPSPTKVEAVKVEQKKSLSSALTTTHGEGPVTSISSPLRSPSESTRIGKVRDYENKAKAGLNGASHSHSPDFIVGRRVTLVIESMWETSDFCGLTAVEVLLTSDLKVAKLEKKNISADPVGLEAIGYDGDPRTPDKLLDGWNNTTDEDHMWLFPFTLKGRHELYLDLMKEDTIYGIRVWNYNKSIDTVRSRGAKTIAVLIDDKIVMRCLLRIVRLIKVA